MLVYWRRWLYMEWLQMDTMIQSAATREIMVWDATCQPKMARFTRPMWGSHWPCDPSNLGYFSLHQGKIHFSMLEQRTHTHTDRKELPSWQHYPTNLGKLTNFLKYILTLEYFQNKSCRGICSLPDRYTSTFINRRISIVKKSIIVKSLM